MARGAVPARNIGSVINNNLSRGLITEATGLNFPENAVTDALNTVFEPKGNARRRLGIDLEGDAETLTYDTSQGVIKEFIWRTVANQGGFTFLVLQIGDHVHFFQLAAGENVSSGIAPVSVDLTDYKAPGASVIRNTPASFSSGTGYLFIAHPMCDPVVVRWNSDEEEFEQSRVTIQIRDIEGVDDELAIGEEPSTLTDRHHYNLKNQGWFRDVRVGTVSNELGDATENGIPGGNGSRDWSPVS